MQNGGVPTAESYGKYKAMEGECHNGDIVSGSKVIKVLRIPNPSPKKGITMQQSVNALKMAIWTHGPVLANIYASSNFVNYVLQESYEIFSDPEWYDFDFVQNV